MRSRRRRESPRRDTPPIPRPSRVQRIEDRASSYRSAAAIVEGDRLRTCRRSPRGSPMRAPPSSPARPRRAGAAGGRRPAARSAPRSGGRPPRSWMNQIVESTESGERTDSDGQPTDVGGDAVVRLRLATARARATAGGVRRRASRGRGGGVLGAGGKARGAERGERDAHEAERDGERGRDDLADGAEAMRAVDGERELLAGICRQVRGDRERGAVAFDAGYARPRRVPSRRRVSPLSGRTQYEHGSVQT